MHSETENFHRVLQRRHPSHVPTQSCGRGACYRGAWPSESRPDASVREWRDEWGNTWRDRRGGQVSDSAKIELLPLSRTLRARRGRSLANQDV